jgi:hypothetical protein
MSDRRVWTSRLGAAVLLAAAGCQATADWHWPWQKSSYLTEQYVTPPEGDSRYLDPPKYARSTVSTPKAEPTGEPRRLPQTLGAPVPPSSRGNYGF